MLDKWLHLGTYASTEVLLSDLLITIGWLVLNCQFTLFLSRLARISLLLIAGLQGYWLTTTLLLFSIDTWFNYLTALLYENRPIPNELPILYNYSHPIVLLVSFFDTRYQTVGKRSYLLVVTLGLILCLLILCQMLTSCI